MVCSPLTEALAGSRLPVPIYVFVVICFYFLLVFVTKNAGENNYIVADLFLIICMVLGFLAQIFCLSRSSNTTFVQFGRLGQEHSTTYLMAGIYVFGLGTLATIMLRLLIYYHAHELITNCQLKNISQIPLIDILQAEIHNAMSNTSVNATSLLLSGGYCYTDVAFDALRPLFTLFQLCFIQAFREATFKRSIFVQFTLYHTIVTNGCVWIRYVVNETHLFHHAEYHASIDQFTTKAFHMEEIMIPFILEYSLLAAGLLYTISSHMVGNFDVVHDDTPLLQDAMGVNPQDLNANGTDTHENAPLQVGADIHQEHKVARAHSKQYSHQNNDVVHSNEEHMSAELEPDSSCKDHQAPPQSEMTNRQEHQAALVQPNANGSQEYQAALVQPNANDGQEYHAALVQPNANGGQEYQAALVQPNANGSQECQAALVQPNANGDQELNPAAGSQPGLICGAFLGLLLPLSSLMFSEEQTKFSRRSHDFFLAYEGILALLQIIAIIWTLNLLQYHKKSGHKLHSEDTLLLIGYLGTFAFHWIAVYCVCKNLNTRNPHNEGTDILTVIHLLILVVSHLLQTILVIISRRYSLIRKQEGSAKKIRQIALFMLTTNLGFWALDSFVEMKDGASSSYPSGKIVLKDSWRDVTSVTYPFVVFFRFHSAEMLYEFWSRFRLREQAWHQL